MAKAPPPISTTAELIRAIVGDPKSPRSLRTLKGYVGESWRDGHTRIYLDLAFQRFVDVPVGDIVSRRSLGEAGGPLEATFLWINADADIHLSPNFSGAFPGPITELSCPPQTIHSDCPTPTFNTAGCGVTESGCGGFTEDGCGGFTEDCATSRFRGRRRYW